MPVLLSEGHPPGQFPLGHNLPGHFPRPDNFPSLLTWCMTFPQTTTTMRHKAIYSNCKLAITRITDTTGWLRGTVVERRSLTGELSLSCA